MGKIIKAKDVKPGSLKRLERAADEVASFDFDEDQVVRVELVKPGDEDSRLEELLQREAEALAWRGRLH